MYLKTLELHGFKSFPDKTVLHFNPGATVIVGPNGSGKSNITDAMRWVLGEISTKNIRGSKMEDVIFVGADGHRPMSFAEVSITFDDSDEPRKLNYPYEEVTVTRRYYRAGESEYFINRKPCRLKDIKELFMNTGIGRDGYSIIGQGKIAEIISKKSEDRRGIFEESAGITKFRYQKNESEKKLAETEDNMNRVLDIYNEIESRIGPLERDAKKARQYLDLYDEKKKLDVSVWLYDTEKIRKDADKAAADCRLSAHELEMAEDDERALEAKYDRLFEAYQQNKQESARIYERIREINEYVRKCEESYRTLENEATHKEALAAAAMTSAEKSEADILLERQNIDGIRDRLSEIGKNIDDANKKIRELEEKKEEANDRAKELERELSDSLRILKETEREQQDLRVRLDVIKNSLTDQSDRETTVIRDLEKYSKELAEIDSESEDCRKSVEMYESALEKSDSEIAKCDRQILELSDKAEVARRSLSAVKAEKEALHSRIAALARMQEHFDGYNNSVKYVMQAHTEGKLRGIHGPLSLLVKVSEKYTVALETALGAALQNIVVDDEAAAKAAIYALKGANAGRATFYPLSSIKGQSRTRELEDAARSTGFIGYADELVRTDDRYKDIVSSIIGRIAVFDNIDNATAVARRCNWKIRIVTLDGQQINMGGSFTGGSVRKDSGMLSRASHIDKLREDEKELDKKADGAEKELSVIEAKLTELSNYRRKEDEKVKISEVMLRTERAQLDEYEANRNMIMNLLEKLTHDKASMQENSKRGGEDIIALEAAIARNEKTAGEISQERAELDIRRNEALDEALDIERAINDHRIEIAGYLKDAENCEASISEAEERASKREAEKEESENTSRRLLEEAESARSSIREKQFEVETLRGELSEKEQERAKLDANDAEYDRKLNEIRIKTREVSNRKELSYRAHMANESKLEKLTAEIDKMVSRLWDEYELTHATAVALDYPPITEKTRAESVSRLNELKKAVKALGHVNVGAIEEYALLKERYDYLKEQLDDLTKSKSELEGIIGTIEEEMKRMFVDAFERINTYFGETFKELFGGGSAQLTLTDPENVLSSGVEINVAPPGKMIKNLTLLSGGEQAFVAIALIFALIKVNPSPFCIFDEIEAALDEVNVTRVANYVKRFSKEMQIILISHRRGMMETADTLYGVTMPRHGISKVFTLDVNAVAENPAEADKYVQ
ncbi:MAG: chromosome segregation protein SMC [Clostridia bacterium]|nr:chromosome segregation protein SMC [Clostridia bacterium]